MFKIAHNDIQGENILIENFFGQILLKYIDFDIGENQSPTLKNSKIIGPKGYSLTYVAPEILKYVHDKNPILNPGVYSP